jgi:hypothetical protein
VAENENGGGDVTAAAHVLDEETPDVPPSDEEENDPSRVEASPFAPWEMLDEPDEPKLSVATRNGHGSDPVAYVGEWPAPPHGDAYHGLAGDVVRAIEPHSEADPVALLVQTLAAFGCLTGRGPHQRVEANEHPGRLYVALVGASSRSRKGTSWEYLRQLFAQADDSFPDLCAAGLSSGEGLIDRVRDSIGEGEEPRDKRLLVVEPELASVLKVVERQENNLSPVLRNAWDGTTLSTLTRNSPLKSTDANICVIGHITTEELQRRLDQTESANGFGNRFLWIAVRRSKKLPEGGDVSQHALNGLSGRLASSLEHARRAGRISRDHDARKLWADVYGDLTEGCGGLTGALTSRGEAQVVRLSLLYALLDQADTIGEQHLRSALALWDYSARSVAHVFGDSTGNPIADTILRALRATLAGLTRTEISNLLGRNVRAGEIDQALTELLGRSRAYFTTEETGGRRAERWHHGKQP